MRTETLRSLCLATAASGLLAVSGAASADTLLTDFDNYSLFTDPYAAWATGTLTPGPTSYNVQASGGFGGQWNDLDPNVDATGETDIELIVTVNTSDPVTGLGVVLALVDEDGTEWQYQINTIDNSWYGLLPGTTNTLTVPVSGATGLISAGTEAGLDLSNLTGFHIQTDTGGNPAPYDVSFENLRLFVPSAAIDGDLDEDGFVGLSDLDILLNNWNQNVPPADPRADPSDDNFVGLDDLDVVLNNWNAGTPPPAAAVPEPAAIALLGLGGLALLKRQ